MIPYVIECKDVGGFEHDIHMLGDSEEDVMIRFRSDKYFSKWHVKKIKLHLPDPRHELGCLEEG